MPGEGAEVVISAEDAVTGEKKRDLERDAEREPKREQEKNHVDTLLEQFRARLAGERPDPITVHEGRKLLDALRKDRKASGKDGDEYSDEIKRERAAAEVLRKIEEGEDDGYGLDEIRDFFSYYRDEIDTWEHPVGGTDATVAAGNQQVYEHIYAYAVERLPIPEASVKEGEIPRYEFSDIDAVLAPLEEGISLDAIVKSYQIIEKDIAAELKRAETDPENKEWLNLRDVMGEAREAAKDKNPKVVVMILHPDGTREIKDFEANKAYSPKLDGGVRQFILDFEQDGKYLSEIEEFTDLEKVIGGAIEGINGLKGAKPEINSSQYSKTDAFLKRLELATTGTEKYAKVEQIGGFLRPQMIKALKR